MSFLKQVVKVKGKRKPQKRVVVAAPVVDEVGYYQAGFSYTGQQGAGPVVGQQQHQDYTGRRESDSSNNSNSGYIREFNR